ncbi:MAG TPA: cytidylate kinase-like family protein, partial [Desulfobacteraceae bacterium]|nr:cytidylate kinase-like family protein [Desulfobacteraceae bacterium]
ISREFGAGGKTLGEIISKKLGYEYVDKEIITKIAEKIKVSSGDVLSYEKYGATKLTKFLDKIVSSDFIERLISDKYGYMDEERYAEMLKAIIRELYEHGNVVIIGRGSQYILRGYENVWHILLVADNDYRLRFVMDKLNYDEKDALTNIKQEDKIRERFLSHFNDRLSQNDPRLYDLVINMSRISLEKAEEMILKLVS